MSTVFLAAFVATFGSSLSKESLDSFSSEAPIGMALAHFEGPPDDGATTSAAADPADVEKLLRTVFPDAEMRTLTTARAPGYTPSKDVGVIADDVNTSCARPVPGAGCDGTWRMSEDDIAVASSSDFEFLTGVKLSADEATLLDTGGAISLLPDYVQDGKASLSWQRPAPAQNDNDAPGPNTVERTAKIDAAVAQAPYPLSIDFVVSSQTAQRLGVPVETATIAISLGHPPTPQQSDAVNAGLSALVPAAQQWNLGFDYSDAPDDFGATIAWVALVIAGIIMLASSAVAIGLARSDARRDDEVLDAIGSPPALRRRIAFWQGLVIAGVGAIVGTAIGMLPNVALAIQFTAGPDADPILPVDPPWLQLALLAFAVPAVIALGSALTSGRRRVRVRRAA